MPLLCLEDEIRLNMDRIPQKFRVDSLEHPVAYRGDEIGLERIGILSKAYSNQDYERIQFAKRIIEGGNEAEIQKLIDSHTSCSRGSRLYQFGSPLISVTLNPEIAQVFATRPRTTIYRIKIPSNRAICDYGPEGKFGLGQEILVLGLIKPSEIVAVKANNGIPHSELYDPRFNAVRYLPRQDSFAREVKQPNNWIPV